MPPRPSQRPAEPDWSTKGVIAARAGSYESARQHFERAVKADKRNSGHRLNLAVVLERLGEAEAAVQQLTEALRHAPGLAEAARRLASLLSRYEPQDPVALDPFGLKAALAFDGIDQAPVCGAILARLKALPPLAGLLKEGGIGDPDALADDLIARRTSDLLKDDLLLTALEKGLNKDRDLEVLFTALRRRIALGLADERFEDKALQAFAIALARQCSNNDYVWVVREDEAAALAGGSPQIERLLEGDPAEGRKLTVAALYRPIRELLPAGIDPARCHAIKPRLLREVVEKELAEAGLEHGLAAALPRLTPVTDTTSKVVAAQYAKAPYPRWSSVQLSLPGILRQALGRFIPADKLGFFEQPFEVLIAGCGTGRQALQSTVGYGPNARVLAIDLSRPSLAYAARKAEAYRVPGITFAEADILELGGLGRRFRIIEAMGVLHHMADPFAGWSRLLDLLEPDGLMYVGLYSAVSRKAIADLRREPSYPGPACSDDVARAYRQELIRRDGKEGHGFLASRDFYALNEFRDLVLHPSEIQLTLPQIAEFIDRSGLIFRGFTLDPEIHKVFSKRFPSDPWPGSLANWQAFEEAHPRLFDAMYRFWVQKPA